MDMNMNMSSNSSMMGMSMGMEISWTTSCVTFLFSIFHADSPQLFYFGCFATFLFAIFVQLIQGHSFKRLLTGVDHSRMVLKSPQSAVQNKSQSMTLKSQQGMQKLALPSKFRLFVFYTVSSLLNLLLMLVAMTMNGYVIFSIAIGAGVGKTIIDSRKMLMIMPKSEQMDLIPEQSPKNDHCQI